MPNQVLFVAALGAESTPRERELQQSEARRHAAIVSHRRKTRLLSKRQRKHPLRYGRLNSQNETGPPHTNLTTNLSALANSPLVSALSGSRGYCASSIHLEERNHVSLHPLPQTANLPLVTSPDALTASEYYAEIHPGNQQPLFEELEEIEEAANPQIVAALLKAGIHRELSTDIKSSIPTKLISYNIHGYSASFYRAFEYFMRVLVPNNTPVYNIFEVSNVNCLYFLEIIESSRAQYLFHSAFALLHLVVGNVAPQTSSSRNALQHTVAAISLLRRMISEQGNRSDDATFIAVVCLASFSRALGDYSGYSIHRNRLAQMMKSRGGLGNTGFQGFVTALTLQFAPPNCIPLSLCFDQPLRRKAAGAVDSTDPFFYDTRRLMPEPPPSSPLNVKLATNLKRLPLGFQSLILQATLSTNTTRLLYRITDALAKQSQPQDCKQQETTPNTGRWQVARYSDFWECCPSISRVGPDLEKYLCLSLLLYTANEFAPERACHKGMALYGGPRTLLATEIGLLSRVRLTPSEKDCWMWIWWVVIDSWSEADKLTETGMSLMTQFWAAFPEVQRGSKLRETLGRFFWGGKFEAAVGRLVDAPPTTAAPTGADGIWERE